MWRFVLQEHKPHLAASRAELRRQRSGGRGDPGSGRRQISCSKHKTTVSSHARLYLKLRKSSKDMINDQSNMETL